MIDKFVGKFLEFISNEDIAELQEDAQIALFGIYLQALKLSEPSVAPAAPAAAPVSRGSRVIKKPNRPATAKQARFIKQLVGQGKLDSDIDIDDLTVGQASDLINQGIKAQPQAAAPAPAPAAPAPAPEKEGEYTGSYSHSSGGSSSSANFWD